MKRDSIKLLIQWRTQMTNEKMSKEYFDSNLFYGKKLLSNGLVDTMSKDELIAIIGFLSNENVDLKRLLLSKKEKLNEFWVKIKKLTKEEANEKA